jgi:hypothetical protein
MVWLRRQADAKNCLSNQIQRFAKCHASLLRHARFPFRKVPKRYDCMAAAFGSQSSLSKTDMSSPQKEQFESNQNKISVIRPGMARSSEN